MNWTDLISLVLNIVLGGGLIVTIVTLKSQRRKASAEADTIAIDNTEKITKLWEDYAAKKTAADEQQIQGLTDKVNEFEKIVNSLRKEISKLTRAINEAKKCPVENCPALKKLEDV